MSTTVEICPLTKLDIQAMKGADKVGFYHRDGRGFLRMTKVIKQEGPYGDIERDYILNVDSSVAAYDLSKEFSPCRNVTHSARCCHYESSVNPRYDAWTAICALVREGDDLRMEWIADGSNGYMKAEYRKQSDPLHFDEMRVHIRRKGKEMFTLLVAYSHCPSNSARMIRDYDLESD